MNTYGDLRTSTSKAHYGFRAIFRELEIFTQYVTQPGLRVMILIVFPLEGNDMLCIMIYVIKNENVRK
jgi:hypothetical protein